MNSEVNNLYEFGKFRFDGGTNRLWKDKELILLSPKASELLKVLLERRGEFVSKQEIFDSVWAETFVEDGVLTQNIYTLRKILGADADGAPLIENRTRRGYRIAVPVSSVEQSNGKPQFSDTNNHEFKLAARLPAESAGVEIDEAALPESSSAKKSARLRRIGLWSALALLLLSTAVFTAYHFRPDKFFRSKTIIVKFQQLTETGQIYFPTVSPDGNFLLYSQEDKIFLKDLKADSALKLEINGVEKFGFSQFSRDGSRIFVRNRLRTTIAGDVFQVSRFGGATRIIAENVWSGIGLAPDEKHLAFVRFYPKEDRNALVVKNIESGEEREIYSSAPPHKLEQRCYPSWSPDGRRIVISNNERGRVLIVEAETGKTEEFKIPNLRKIEQITWLPGGDAFVAAANDVTTAYQVWKIYYPGGETERLTNDLNNYRDLTITADGKKVAAQRNNFRSQVWTSDFPNFTDLKQLNLADSKRDAIQEGFTSLNRLDENKVIFSSVSYAADATDDLWLADLEKNYYRQLTSDKGSIVGQSAASVDGKNIFFTLKQTDETQIWQMETGGGNQKQITYGEPKRFPQVSPDGKWLYFLQKAQTGSAIWRKSLIDEKVEKLTDEKFNPETFLALSPDGKQLAFRNQTESPDRDNSKNNVQFCFIAIEKPLESKCLNLFSSLLFVRWAKDGKSFYYVDNSFSTAKMWRQSLDDKISPVQILAVPNTRILNFSWTADEKHLAVSLGKLSNDAVLLTDFSE
jgi:Tol biopolymer transport system component/DNA-binding winged helix-turn-helix (wHTH) protein